jgi:hypothetical protein
VRLLLVKHSKSRGESCGVADLIATCYGGRNRLVVMEYTRQSLVSVQECGALCWACGCCTLQSLVSRCSVTFDVAHRHMLRGLQQAGGDGVHAAIPGEQMPAAAAAAEWLEPAPALVSAWRTLFSGLSC